MIADVSGDRVPSNVDVAIVGAGAAGLAVGIFAAGNARDANVVILDGAVKIGAKILIAGGGRCNVTNRVVRPADFCGGHRPFIKRVLAAFTVDQTIAFFRELGVDLEEEEHGKLFPTTNKARTVLNALCGEVRRYGVSLYPDHRVTNIERRDGGFRITTSRNTLQARRVVLATGGKSLPKSGSDGAGYSLACALGHSVVPTTPALVPLVLAGDFHTQLSGIAQDVELTLKADGAKATRVSGALLWTHFGISGPAVLDISRYWHRAALDRHDVHLTVSFLPGADFTKADRRLQELAFANPKMHLRNALARLLPARVAEAILRHQAIDGQTVMAGFRKDSRRKLVHALLSWPLPVLDSRGFTHAEVTAGGIPLSEVDPSTMASRKCPGLFLIGEILDVDGRIGGFNFQWSWSSAHVAGRHIM